MDRIGIVFPGQGSQTVGMLSDIADQFTEVIDTFDEASDILNYDLWELVQNGPAHELDKTIHTQPALLAASYAIWLIFQSRKHIVPTFLAGHSLGEYTALVCAKAMTFPDAIKLVASRGQFMQEASPPDVGAMAAIISLDEGKVAAICERARESEKEVLSPANFNSIGQIVIAGHKPAVLRAIKLAKEEGAKLSVLIPVSVPSHCRLMQPAAKRLAQELKSIQLEEPHFPVISNVDAKPYDSVESIRDGLERQLYLPLRWVETIEKFKQAGINQIIECGPGKVLTGLNKRIDKNFRLISTHDVVNLQALLKEE